MKMMVEDLKRMALFVLGLLAVLALAYLVAIIYHLLFGTVGGNL